MPKRVSFRGIAGLENLMLRERWSFLRLRELVP